jgi:hypothetical protein
MSKCVTCGSELHPERAAKYDYCTRRDCQRQNARGLEILAVGVNKAADQYEVVDGRTRAETAARADGREPIAPVRATRPGRGTPHREPHHKRAGRSWSEPQQDLARIYHDRGMRPDEIARKLGLSTHTVIQMILAARDAS